MCPFKIVFVRRMELPMRRMLLITYTITGHEDAPHCVYLHSLVKYNLFDVLLKSVRTKTRYVNL